MLITVSQLFLKNLLGALLDPIYYKNMLFIDSYTLTN